MSQHRFLTSRQGEQISVLLGWDRPLQCFFMVIERVQPAGAIRTMGAADDDAQDDASVLYSNLFEDDAFGLSVYHFRSKLVELGIYVPPVMFDQIEIDRANGTGNRTVTYNSDGTVVDGSL